MNLLKGLAPHAINDLTLAFKEISKKTTLAIIEQKSSPGRRNCRPGLLHERGKDDYEMTTRQAIKDLVFETCL